MTRTPLLIGEAPASGSLGCFSLAFGRASRSGDRLRRLLGDRPFDAVNLLARPLARGERWPARSAAASAALLYRDCLAGREVVFLGRRVAKAFRGLSPWTDALADASWFSSAFPTVPKPGGGWDRCVLWIAPHPSGSSRWWNDHANRARARAFFLRVLCAEEFPLPPALPSPRDPAGLWPLADTACWPGFVGLPGRTRSQDEHPGESSPGQPKEK